MVITTDTVLNPITVRLCEFRHPDVMTLKHYRRRMMSYAYDDTIADVIRLGEENNISLAM